MIQAFAVRAVNSFRSVSLSALASFTLIALGASAFSPSTAAAQTDAFRNHFPQTTLGPATGAYDNELGSPILALVDSAKRTIDIEIYQMDNLVFANHLRSALARGVQIRVVKEPRPIGDSCNLFPVPGDVVPTDPVCLAQYALKAQILKAGGSYVPFNKRALCADQSSSCFQHGKLIIVDGGAALISTGNFNSSNLCDLSAGPSRCDRDFTVITRVPGVLAALNQIFQRDLIGERYDVMSVLTTTPGDIAVTVSPASLAPLVSFINSAKVSIEVENQYLNDPRLNAALLRAQARGVEVHIMVSSVCAFGSPTSTQVANVQRIYGAFMSAGAEVRMFTSRILVRGVPGYMHAKVFIVDGKKAWVGSVNGSTGAISNNREYGLFLSDARSVRMLSDRLRADRDDPGSETWQESIACAKDSAPRALPVSSTTNFEG